MHPAHVSLLSGLLIALAIGRPLGAQGSSVVEIGLSAVRFPADALTTVGPTARWSGSSASGPVTTGATIGAVVGSSGASGYGAVTGRGLRSLSSHWYGELGAELGALFATDARTSTRATSGVATARALRPVDAGGVWLRGSGSLATRSPDALGGGGIGAGVWWTWPGGRLTASLGREWNEAQLFRGPGREGYAGTVPVAYSEASLGVEGARVGMSWSASGTVRRDPGAERVVDAGARVTLAYWQTPTLALMLSVASELPDFVHGADAARVLMLGVRLRGSVAARPPATMVQPIVHVAGDSAVRTIEVRAAGASQVEVMGDFTDWAPVPLVREGDVFRATVRMAGGSRRLVVRVDGGPWRPAANTPAVDDDFGGRVGLLLVP